MFYAMISIPIEVLLGGPVVAGSSRLYKVKTESLAFNQIQTNSESILYIVEGLQCPGRPYFCHATSIEPDLKMSTK